jgi:penicillin-binding protein 1A
MRQVLVDKFGPGTAFSGGLRVRTSIDLQMQETASQIAYDALAGISPTAAVVVLDNDTGEVRAMVGGSDYEERPFNLATQGYRQPGSTFKTFVLATALSQGRSPGEVFSSQPKQFPIPGVNPNKEMFVVENYDDDYLGSASIATATQYSDNSVYAELGLQVGTKKIARMAQDMGVETPVSTNPAMTLGGLDNYCCTPLEMTHAYQTLSAGGNRISGTLDSIEGDVGKDPRDDGPVPIVKITDSKGDLVAENKVTKSRVLSSDNANTVKGILQSVVSGGTGTNAATGGYAWGKTGTTEDYGDAWFCGGSENFTTCVWVGYPDSVKAMKTEYGGEPVAGGTYPAVIWSRIIQALEGIQAGYRSGRSESSSSSFTPSYSAPAAPAAPAVPPAP